MRGKVDKNNMILIIRLREKIRKNGEFEINAIKKNVIRLLRRKLL